jgi:Zn-dependent M16 (insulinase) family peptidase
LPFIGTKKHRYDEFEKLLHSCTGGIGTRLDTYSNTQEHSKHKESLILSFAFLNENVDQAMTLITELLAGNSIYHRMQ